VPRSTPWKDEYTLLCERCGYVIEGLDRSGNCPECGKPIAESLPERRVGTPWQQSPGVKSLLATWWMTLRHPRRTLDVMRVGTRRNVRWLGRWAIGLAALISATGFVLSTHLYDTDPMRVSPLITILTVPIWMILPFVLLSLLTWIETRGLIIIAKARGFRVDRPLAWTITAHGAIGWLIAGILFAVLFNASPAFVRAMSPKPLNVQIKSSAGILEPSPDAKPIEYTGTSTTQGTTQTFTITDKEITGNQPIIIRPRAKPWIYWIGWSIWGLGLLIGFLFFETFAYLGLRRCKFVNRVRPETADEPTAESPRMT